MLHGYSNIWIKIVLQYKEKQKIFTSQLKKNVETNLIIQVMNYTDHYRENNKLLGIMKHQLGREIREDFSALGAKRYSFLKMIIMKIKSKKTKN